MPMKMNLRHTITYYCYTLYSTDKVATDHFLNTVTKTAKFVKFCTIVRQVQMRFEEGAGQTVNFTKFARIAKIVKTMKFCKIVRQVKTSFKEVAG